MIIYKDLEPEVDYLINNLGKNVHDARIRLSLSQEALAEMIERSASYISTLETGRVKCTIKTICALAIALETTPNNLLSFEVTNNRVEVIEKKLKKCSQKFLEIIDALIDHELQKPSPRKTRKRQHV